jgi:hypothetical protein
MAAYCVGNPDTLMIPLTIRRHDGDTPFRHTITGQRWGLLLLMFGTPWALGLRAVDVCDRHKALSLGF